MFQHFHYPFSLRIPPRWKLIHGCLRCATVRLLTNSDTGLVPQCYRAYYRSPGDVDAALDAAHDMSTMAKENMVRHREDAANRARKMAEGVAGPQKVVELKEVPVDNDTKKVGQPKVLEALRAIEKPLETKAEQPTETTKKVDEKKVVEEELPKTHGASSKTDNAPAKPAVDVDTKIQASPTRPKIQVEIEANITEIPRRVHRA